MKNILTKERIVSLLLGCVFGAIVALSIRAWFEVYGVRSPIVIKWEVIKQSTIYKKDGAPAPLVTPQKAVKGSNSGDKVKKVLSPTPTPKKLNKKITNPEKQAIVNASKYPDFIDHIWERESGRGSNTAGLAGKCLEKGMTNEFGFYPSGGWCFETFEKAVARIELWREREAKGLSDSQALCYYNGAGKVNSCAYLSYNFEAMN